MKLDLRIGGWLGLFLVPSVALAQTIRVLVPGQPAWSVVPAPRPPAVPIIYEQRQYGPSIAPLVTPVQASNVIRRFEAIYAGWGHPRLLISVNREILDGTAAVESSGTTNGPVSAAWTPEKLADFQTSREVERLFGYPLRMASAQIIDYQTAADWLSAHPGLTASDRRIQLMSVADLVIEVLISARPNCEARWPGDVPVAVPDVQATVIRLADSRIMGQASASDLLGSPTRATQLTRTHGVPAIVGATALALVEDMAKTAP